MSKLFQDLNPRPHKGKNGFDLSMRRAFTSSCGQLLPVFYDFSNPGDKYKLNSRLFTRTEALQTSAFVRLKEHVDWFFVPVTQLYSFWNEFFNQTNDINTSLVTSMSTTTNIPYFNIIDVVYTPSELVVFTPDNARMRTDEFGVPLFFNACRMMDLLGYGDYRQYEELSEGITLTFNCNPLSIMAYHKIFYSYYRNTDYNSNDVSMYNLDRLYNSKVITVDGTNKANPGSGLLFGTIHYRPWRKDYFTTAKPAPIYGSAYASSFGLNRTPDFYSAKSPINYEGSLYANGGYGSAKLSIIDQSAVDSTSSVSRSGIGVNYIPTSDIHITAGDIRALYAYDKLLRVTAAAGGHYEDQIKAHFGVDVPKGVGQEVYHLGSQVTDLNINEVVAQASTEQATLGQIAGKGFGLTNGDGDIHFTAPCHGFVMAIFSVEPLADYAQFGCDRFNRYSTTQDFYHPEFDNLGMQPLFKGEYSVVETFADGPASQKNVQDIYGWQPRYQELKSKYDVVNGGFYANKTDWVGWRQYEDNDGYGVDMLGDSRLYIPPTYCDNIFLSNYQFGDLSFDQFYDSHGHSRVPAQYIYNRDNFLHSLDIKCYKSSLMSVHSLPKL